MHFFAENLSSLQWRVFLTTRAGRRRVKQKPSNKSLGASSLNYNGIFEHIPFDEPQVFLSIVIFSIYFDTFDLCVSGKNQQNGYKLNDGDVFFILSKAILNFSFSPETIYIGIPLCYLNSGCEHLGEFFKGFVFSFIFHPLITCVFLFFL